MTTSLLYIAAFFTFVIGVLHSVLGERFILVRLFRLNGIPKLFGSTDFTIRTLRFAWHITTVAWWGLATMMILLAENAFTFQSLSMVLAATFLVSSLIALVGSHGRHFSWPVFLLIGGTILYTAFT